MKLWAVDIRIVVSQEEVSGEEINTLLGEVEELLPADSLVEVSCLGVKEARIQLLGEP